MIDAASFFDEVDPLVRYVCSKRAFRFPIDAVTVEDRVAESWLWILQRWPDVEGAIKPVGMACRIAKLASYAIEVQHMGRVCMMRGKRHMVKGYRDDGAGRLYESGGGDPVPSVSYLRRTRPLGPVGGAIVREELERCGGDPRAVIEKYGGRRCRFLRDPHFCVE